MPSRQVHPLYNGRHANETNAMLCVASLRVHRVQSFLVVDLLLLHRLCQRGRRGAKVAHPTLAQDEKKPRSEHRCVKAIPSLMSFSSKPSKHCMIGLRGRFPAKDWKTSKPCMPKYSMVVARRRLPKLKISGCVLRGGMVAPGTLRKTPGCSTSWQVDSVHNNDTNCSKSFHNSQYDFERQRSTAIGVIVMHSRSCFTIHCRAKLLNNDTYGKNVSLGPKNKSKHALNFADGPSSHILDIYVAVEEPRLAVACEAPPRMHNNDISCTRM
jgi:hypothetical protein